MKSTFSDFDIGFVHLVLCLACLTCRPRHLTSTHWAHKFTILQNCPLTFCPRHKELVNVCGPCSWLERVIKGFGIWRKRKCRWIWWWNDYCTLNRNCGWEGSGLIDGYLGMRDRFTGVWWNAKLRNRYHLPWIFGTKDEFRMQVWAMYVCWFVSLI